MGTIISIVKIIMFLFPFVKEVVIGKDKDPVDRRRRPSTVAMLIKKFFILLVCLSLVMNYYLAGRVFDLGKKNIELKKQIADKPKHTVEPTQNKPAPLPHPTTPPSPEYTAPKKPKPPKSKPPDMTTKPEDDILTDLEEITKIR